MYAVRARSRLRSLELFTACQTLFAGLQTEVGSGCADVVWFSNFLFVKVLAQGWRFRPYFDAPIIRPMD